MPQKTEIVSAEIRHIIRSDTTSCTRWRIPIPPLSERDHATLLLLLLSSVFRYFLRQRNLHREERNAANLRFENGSVRQQEHVTMHSNPVLFVLLGQLSSLGPALQCCGLAPDRLTD